MEMVIDIILMMIILELVENYLHKAETLGDMIDKLYQYYKKSIFLFFLVHPTFYFTLLVSLYLNILNIYIIIILIVKSFDILFKLELIRERYVYDEMDNELSGMLNLDMKIEASFLGIFTYVPLLFLAIEVS